MKHITYLFLFLFFLNLPSEAQVTTLSEAAEISIITVGPGKNLYDKFGHSAFRVKDEANGIDWAYNYGTYDFNTPNFYTKFAQGKLNYNLSVAYFEAFYQNYIQENRWVKEQVLNLSSTEKNELFQYLQNNAKPENRGYLYDFFFDNCATRIRDVLKAVLGEELQYNDRFVTEQYTFRELIQKNVKANTWGSLGMDVAIGAVVDRPASAWEYQFLPQYVFEAAAVATVTKGNTKEPLVITTNSLFENTPQEETSNFFMSPLFVIGLLGLIILFVTYQDFRKRKRSRYLDGIIFFSTGFIGFLLLLLWIATDHSTTVNNYNLLWAFPLSLFLCVAISKKQPKKWLSKYYAFLLILFALLCLHSISGVQTFAIGFIPLFVALAIRYIYVLLFLKKTDGKQKF
ncbi:DUF4105 domain-containing protein [Aureisphaera sp. CAU 1614]|uniref:DUF4105 domain-containing protein n=1 Tax=Halomarinibacterium sedimenti TaxID=2857106 RepID=A0A9X1JYN5_9FLAO|nr:DUF4105 domain-containing protein [Halomarinibacterium sedimenti]MBW2937697.1 DUF4105 domain-containing protein [Halomarinibacterium sedimenti]